MKAIVLAAGFGKRMGTMTQSIPKPLIKLNNIPLLEHTIKRLIAAGIKEIYINAHYHSKQIQDYISNANFSADINVIVEDELLDTAGGIVNIIPRLNDEIFLVVSADIYTSFDFSKITIDKDSIAKLIMVPNPSYNSSGDYKVSDNLLKPICRSNNENTYTYGNIGLFRNEFFKDSPKRVIPLKFFIDKNLKNHNISADIFYGEWVNIGTPEELERAEQLSIL